MPHPNVHISAFRNFKLLLCSLFIYIFYTLYLHKLKAYDLVNYKYILDSPEILYNITLYKSTSIWTILHFFITINIVILTFILYLPNVLDFLQKTHPQLADWDSQSIIFFIFKSSTSKYLSIGFDIRLVRERLLSPVTLYLTLDWYSCYFIT